MVLNERSGRIYVAHQDGAFINLPGLGAGRITALDAVTGRVAGEFLLDGHPEALAVDERTGYVLVAIHRLISDRAVESDTGNRWQKWLGWLPWFKAGPSSEPTNSVVLLGP
jgi:hypothetical protein